MSLFIQKLLYQVVNEKLSRAFDVTFHLQVVNEKF